jgi:hypothetical protein
MEGPTRARGIVRLLLGVAGLFVLLFLVTLVPPLERRIPGTPVTFEALFTGVLMVVIFGLLVVVADQLGELTRERLAGSDAVESRTLPVNAGATVQYLVVFLAFLVLYRPLAAATVPFLQQNNTPWVYDVAFAAIALLLLVLIAYYGYRCLDPVTRHVSQTFLGGETEDGTESREPTETSEDDDEQ